MYKRRVQLYLVVINKHQLRYLKYKRKFVRDHFVLCLYVHPCETLRQREASYFVLFSGHGETLFEYLKVQREMSNLIGFRGCKDCFNKLPKILGLIYAEMKETLFKVLKLNCGYQRNAYKKREEGSSFEFHFTRESQMYVIVDCKIEGVLCVLSLTCIEAFNCA